MKITRTEYYVDILLKAKKGIGIKMYAFMFPFYPIDSDIEYLKKRVTNSKYKVSSLTIREKTITWK